MNSDLSEKSLGENEQSYENALPISKDQERIWYLHRLNSESPIFNIGSAMRVDERINVSDFNKCLDEMSRRHDALRYQFPEKAGKPCLAIEPGLCGKLLVVDVEENDKEIDKIIEDEFKKLLQYPFNIEKAPLFRVALLNLPNQKNILIIVMHHIIADYFSLGLFWKELGALYDIERKLPLQELPELTVSHSFVQKEIIKKEYDHESMKISYDFWTKKIKNVHPFTAMPTDRKRPAIPSFKGSTYFFELSKDLSKSISDGCLLNDINPERVFLTAFQSIIHLFTNENHFITAMPFDFRLDSNCKNLIGNFDKLALIHTDFSGNPNFEECLRRVNHEIAEAYKHKDLLFATVAELTQKRFSKKNGSPFKMLFNYDDAPVSDCKSNCLTLENVLVERGVTDFDLFLALSKNKEQFIGAFEYNSDLFDIETIQSFAENYIKLIEKAVMVPNFLVTQYLLKGRLAQNYEDREEIDIDDKVAITASFTILPIEDSIMFWFYELEMPYRFEFAPSSNILKQLLASDGLFLNEDNKFNIVLFRLEDLFNLNNDNPVTFDDKILSKNIDDFVGAIRICLNRTGTPFIVGICPSSPGSELYNDHIEILEPEEKRLIGLLEDLGDVYTIKGNEWREYYNVEGVFDDEVDETGHISYTNEFYTSIAALVTRRIYKLLLIPYKVIVLDCDNTLWSGEIGSDGVQGVKLYSPFRFLQEFMLKKRAEGMLLCLCSKNDEDLIGKYFESRSDSIIRDEHIIARRINWEPKSKNLQSIAAELNLGLDSFIFLDDNPVECAEVRANCPEVLTLEVPGNPQKIQMFLENIWAFDTLKVTDEDECRNRMYEENEERQLFKEQTLDFASFLKELNLKVDIEPLSDSFLTRSSQMTQRTNQFNFTSKERSETQLKELCFSGLAQGWVVNVEDMFGEYGIVGFMITQPTDSDNGLEVESFMVSCRVLGRGVEHKMVSYAGDLALEKGLQYVYINFQTSTKNKPAQMFLENLENAEKIEKRGNTTYKLSAENASKCSIIPAERNQPAVSDCEDGDDSIIEKQTSINFSVSERIDYISKNYQNIEQVVNEMNRKMGINVEQLIDEVVEPKTETEEIVSEIWKEALNVENAGIFDDFFDVGGHSIAGIKIVTKINSRFGIDLSHQRFISSPNIATIASIIDNINEDTAVNL